MHGEDRYAVGQEAQVVRRADVPELLAPAGSPEALEAAIAAGADAVYLGGRLFSARAYAANFSDAELEIAVRTAHERGVRVYVTVNTLVHEAELPASLRFLLWLYSIGADAVLVQDVGLAALAREVLPGLPLHASTQMTIHHREGAFWAAGAGFSRIVLARELALSEVAEIADAVPQGVGLEVFAHGALCYSYSGQCLLSFVIGGRSGNRGMCAQPCRKAYTLLHGQQDEFGRPRDLVAVPAPGRYLLSPRDLSVYPRLDEVARAPIAALKIEGRMKSAEYVAIVTDVYRRGLDAIAGDRFEPSPEDEEALLLAFNRSFTEGYLCSADASGVMGRERSGNRGLAIGTVARYDPRRRAIGLRLAGAVVPERGDGIEIASRDPAAEPAGTQLNAAPVRRGDLLWLPVPGPVAEGSTVSITRRQRLAARARSIAANPYRRPPVPIDIRVAWDADARPVLSGSFPGPGSATLRVEHRGSPWTPAISRPIAAGEIDARLRRTGGTRFSVRSLDIDYPGGLFAPVGVLNQLRRDLLDRAAQALDAAWRPPQALVEAAESRLAEAFRQSVRPAPGPVPAPGVAVYASDGASAVAAAAHGCRVVYLEPDRACSPDELVGIFADTADRLAGEECVLAWKWPRITDRAFLDGALPLLPRAYGAGVRGVLVESLGLAEAVRRAEKRLWGAGGAGLNVWNGSAAQALARCHDRVTLSPELSLPAIAASAAAAAAAGTVSLDVLVQGNIEAMVTRDCLPCTVGGTGVGDAAAGGAWMLRDERDRLFPVEVDCSGRTHIRNAVELCLIDHVPALLEAGIGTLVIDGRGRTARYAGEMASLYREAIRRAAAGSGAVDDLKASAKRMARGGITTGGLLREQPGECA